MEVDLPGSERLASAAFEKESANKVIKGAFIRAIRGDRTELFRYITVLLMFNKPHSPLIPVADDFEFDMPFY